MSVIMVSTLLHEGSFCRIELRNSEATILMKVVKFIDVFLSAVSRNTSMCVNMSYV